MRSISKYEGEKAVVFGWIDQWVKLGSGEVKVLLTQVSVRGHDRIWEEKLDHLWVYTPVEWWESSTLKRLDATAFCGTVFQYTRSDGSKDFGVKRNFSIMPWSQYLGLVKKNPTNWKALDRLLRDRVLYNDFYREYPETFFLFQDELASEKRRIATNLAALETSKGYGFDRAPEFEIQGRRSNAKGFRLTVDTE